MTAKRSPDGKTTAAPIIVAKGLRKVYGDGEAARAALDGVSLTVEPGEFLVILGQSGSGKSTLLGIAGGLERTYEGTVSLFGQDVATLSDKALARLRGQKIGFVFQAFHLLGHLSVLDNVLAPTLFDDGAEDRSARAFRFGEAAGDAKAGAAGDAKAGAAGDAKAGAAGRGLGRGEGAGGGKVRPAERALAVLDHLGIKDRAHDMPSQLSGGQRQRVAIARALLQSPELLLCDEPTGNLDAETGERTIALFRELHREGLTVLAVTHEERLANVATRVIRLKDGRIVDGDAAPAKGDDAPVNSEGGREAPTVARTPVGET